MPSLKLFNIPINIELFELNNGVKNKNMALSDSDFKVHKGADTLIEFSLRNNDRKPINLVGKEAMVTIIDITNESILFQKNIKILNESKGLVQLKLSSAEISSWPTGFLRYSALLINEDGTKTLLATDLNSSSTGTIEVKGDALPGLFEPVVLDPLKFTPIEFKDVSLAFNTPDTRFVSDAIIGDAQKGFSDGLHTFSVKGTNFTGELSVLGSLEPLPSSNIVAPVVDWFPIQLTADSTILSFTDFTGIQAFNFISNITWLKFVWKPDASIVQSARSSGSGQPGTTGSPGTILLGTLDRITVVA